MRCISASDNRSTSRPLSHTSPVTVALRGSSSRITDRAVIDFPLADLSLLSTYYRPVEKPLCLTWATSAATAQVARMSALVRAECFRSVGLFDERLSGAADWDMWLRLARRYRVAYQIEKPRPGDDADQYEVTHSRGVYIFDNQGRARLLASDTDSIEAMTKDLRQLIDLTS